jgi:antitoxin (DNA-binding transcriptional repressor) of toxin-antitoxin stability system
MKIQQGGIMTAPLKIADLLPEMDFFADQFEIMGWAQDEIDAARQRHGESDRGPLWNSFLVLKVVDQPYMWSELIFRAHARELLDRVAAGHDVRTATDAEMIAALRESSLTAPLSPAAATLYFRIAARSFPTLWAVAGDHNDLVSYEAVHGSVADDHEGWLRKKFTRDRG